MSETETGNDFAILFLVMMFLISLVILALQVLFWLKAGEWVELPLSRTLGWFGIPMEIEGWLGVSKILTWLLDFPTTMWVFLVGLIPILTTD